ncbi:hypothetical protein A4H34_02965 [Peptidiphaga gingivicola]|uniref:Uncharacterized protein n=1 Tax=Peptidiphaga gingivicola TaxID=2741497 RepID=A0A179B4V7_9ACTO|nr:hypothetical protein [Peptidiphaga gingivicola]OAP86151.1 hypothetical protein A4H34_02965 [Peptidiphaga gingivicola]
MAAHARRFGAWAVLFLFALTVFAVAPRSAQAAKGANAAGASSRQLAQKQAERERSAGAANGAPSANRAAAGSRGAAPASGAQAAAKGGKRRTVVVVTGGVRWDQLDHARAPNLAQLGASGAMANLVPLATRGAPCPVDTWLAFSAGRQISERAISTTPTCAQPPVAAGDVLPNWDRYTRALAATDPKARLGRFAESLHKAGVTTHSIGDGGAYVLANGSGDVPANHTPNPLTVKELGEETARSAAKYDLTIVDADAESYASDQERDAARQLFQEQRKELENDQQPTPTPTDGIGPENPTPPDTVDGSTLQPDRRAFSAINTLRVESILERVPAGTRVVIMSAVDIDTYSYMQLFVMADVSTKGRIIPVGLAGSDSVRHEGLIQMLDVVPTLFEWAGADRTGIAGSPISVARTADACEQSQPCYTNRVDELADQSLHANKMRTFRGEFIQYMTWAAIGYFLLSLFFFARRFYASTLGRRRAYAKLWQWLGLTLSALPLASLVANYFGWWSASRPYVALFGGSWIGAAAVAAAVLPLARLHSLAPLTVVSCSTAALVAIDAATGSELMADSPVGFNLLTAARFYGIGNEAYALLASGALIGLAFLGVWLRRWGRFAAGGVVLFIGLAIGAIDALPSMGADFGGVLSFVPALGLLVLMVAKLRLSWRRLLVVGTVTMGAAVAIAVVDWMRPAEARTHLGRFVQSVVDGDLLAVVGRKLSTNIRLLSASTHRWVVLAALLLFFLCLIHLVRVPKNPDGAGGALPRAGGALSRVSDAPSRAGGVSSPAGDALSSATDRAEADAGAAVRVETAVAAQPVWTGTAQEGGRTERTETGALGEEALGEDAIEGRSKLRRAIAWCHMWAELVWLRLREWARRTRIRAEESWSLRPLEGRTFEGLRLGLISLGVCMALAFGLNDSGIVLPGMAAILVIPGIAVAAVKDREGGRREVGGNEPTEA